MGLTDEGFGPAPKVEIERPISLAVPLRPLNLIELAVMERCDTELSLNAPPMPFIDGDTGELENAEEFAAMFGRELDAHEAIFVCDVMSAAISEKWRLNLIIARELGPTRRDGPTFEQYRDACAAEGVDPKL